MEEKILRGFGRFYQEDPFLLPLLRPLDDHGLGSICEITDADPPFTPRGCITQAWSVAEVLRALHPTRAYGSS